jgi:predicted transcriptional regulator
MRVADILKSKGQHVVTIVPEESIQSLSQRLRREHIGAVVVSYDGKTIDGIISERDIAHGVDVHGNALLDKKVGDLMTTAVFTCTRDDTVSQLMKLMTEKRIRHVPVFENDELIGLVSIGDVVKFRLEELQMEANVMRDIAIANR